MITKIYGYYNEHDYGRTSVNRNLSSLHDENGNFVPTSVIKNILERFDTKDIFFELENDKYMKAYMNSNFRCIGTESIGYIEPGDRFMISFDEEHIVVKEDCDEYDGVSRKRVVMNFKNLGQSSNINNEEVVETKSKINEKKIEKYVYDNFSKYFKGYKLFEDHNIPQKKMALYLEGRQLFPDLVSISNDDEEIQIVEIKWDSINENNISGQISRYAKAARLKWLDKRIRIVLFTNKESLSLKSSCIDVELHPRVKFDYRLYKYHKSYLEIGVL